MLMITLMPYIAIIPFQQVRSQLLFVTEPILFGPRHYRVAQRCSHEDRKNWNGDTAMLRTCLLPRNISATNLYNLRHHQSLNAPNLCNGSVYGQYLLLRKDTRLSGKKCILSQPPIFINLQLKWAANLRWKFVNIDCIHRICL